jgi:hypothetical protein
LKKFLKGLYRVGKLPDGLRFENISPKCVGLEADDLGLGNVFSIEG